MGSNLASQQNYLYDNVKEAIEETIFIFRLNIGLQNSYLIDEIVTKIEELKYKKFQATM